VPDPVPALDAATWGSPYAILSTVTLDEAECWVRLNQARHGVLSTLHEERGVDLVPVVFAVVNGQIVVPVDTVKPKRHLALTRLANIANDHRCALLVDWYADDWSQLWWVRVHASAERSTDHHLWAEALAARYPQYRQPGSVAAALVLTPTAVKGWSAR
jgi:PPOX class probable F420-dependent enzyme